MKKQKQQVISRFFAPKSKPQNPSFPSSSAPLNPNDPPPPTPPPKITATVAFSPSKRLLSSHLTSSPKRPKLSPHTHNPIPTTPNPSLHQKFLQKLLEPSTSIPQPPPPSNPKLTPLELQVVDLKKRYPDVLLMVEVGYKYRFFGEDAEIAARNLGIYAHMDHSFLTASVPTFRLNVHVRRLVSAGYKVGVVKQTETAAIKAHGANRGGPFGRGLSALYTKATLEAAEGVGGGEEGCGGESSYLSCVVDESGNVGNLESEVRIGIVAVEISTGDVVYGEFRDDFMRSGLEAFVLSLSPAELLLGEPLSKQTEKMLLAFAGPASNVRVERVSRDCFKDGGALAEVMSLYENMDEDKLGDQTEINSEVIGKGNHRLGVEGIMKMPNLAVQALALTIRHLKQFGLERVLHLGASFRPFSSNVEMTLSANALQQLEVLKNNNDGSESGSLLQCMNHTLTIHGSRLLRHWVTHPLCDRNMISARLDAVSEIAESMGSSKACPIIEGDDAEDSHVTILRPEFNYILSSVLTTLGRSPDIQRGITRIFHRTATPSEFIAVIQAILHAGKQLQQLQIDEEGSGKTLGGKAVCSELLRKLILTASSSSIIGNAAKLLSTLNKEAADQQDLQNLITISDGQFPEVAKARKEVQLANEKLNSLIGLYRKQLGMRKLEFMSVSGTTHLIELAVDVKVPSNWVKINSTKKTVRYHPPDVLTALDHLALAKEELTIACRAAWDSFLSGFSKYYAEFQAAIQALASLDCLHSLAVLSRNKNYVRPVFVYDDEPVQIHICSGRHPVLETTLQDNFVPNDTDLHADREYCQIITGPNMGGKSCYIRQVALIAIMAQVGSFVPASLARLHVLDGIYTRMGASDSIQQGRSTFLEELSEASHILHNCTSRSLVIIDELGRGTSTHDGVAIAYATLHHLLQQKRCMVLFVTHYPKIASIRTEFPGSVGAYHVSYLTSDRDRGTVDMTSENEDVTYLYKLVPGVSERSFGFKVAELAQLPSSCIRRATFMADRLEAVVRRRESDRYGNKSLLRSPTMDQKEEVEEEMLGTTGNAYAGENQIKEDIYGSEYNKFFLNLKTAISSDDLTENIRYLNHARSIAQELVSRLK
ncbi:PREDICTED: DNA mismatch repair protein MSH3 [Fragaria vesca subsp. vesca]|uniref:DNA mismatch repair protein MSH3 n=1 Tax=Fragaria vesca subsp. vesca TaxID=101020 RepID=UPI0002C351AF|nr:PREDICTED: DNA mismatch repair protein MSH3 [Fragaria vesca subsp. vesca]